MHINIPIRVLNQMDDDELELFGRNKSNLRGTDSYLLDLLPLSTPTIVNIRGAFERLRGDGNRQVGMLINDINRWIGVIEQDGAGQARPRTLRQFSDLLTQYIRTSPGYRIYQQVQKSTIWLAHYVNYIEYTKEERHRDGGYIRPAHPSK